MTTRPIEHLHVFLSAGAVAGAAVFASPHFALSVGVGALLEGFNFRGLSLASHALFRGALRGGTAWLVLLVLRLGLVGALLFAAIRFGGIDPIGVLVGLSVVLPASVIGAWRIRPPIDPEAGPVDDFEARGRDPRDGPGDWGWDAVLYAEPQDQDRGER